MLGWTDLKFWIAVCWKTSWNDDPLPLSVPLRLPALAVAVPDPVPVAAGALVVVVLDEEHAARESVIATKAAPAVMTCCLRPSCMVRYPSMFPGRDERSRGRPVSL